MEKRTIAFQYAGFLKRHFISRFLEANPDIVVAGKTLEMARKALPVVK